MTTRTERATERAAAKAEGRLTYTEAEADRNVAAMDEAARIARTAPSTDQATTPPGVTGGSGEDEG
jgi:hypothetical protein